jgi:limonene-1,2-epoxide hydrolase
MKKIFFAVIITLMMAGCSQPEKKEDTASDKSAEMKLLYEKNLSTVKTFIADFEKEDINGMASLVADNAVWNSPAYGDTVHTKKHWLEGLKYYMDNWSNLHLTNGQFLPGIDSATHEFDGSVRYYGRWDGIHSSGIATQVKFYGTYEFDKDNKLISGSDFFDLGGLMNAVKPAGK